MDIRYVVAYPNPAGLLGDTKFSTHNTHDKALELVNELMHDFTLSEFDDNSIKPKDFIHWKDGQELEFLKHCKQCSENGEFWTNYAIYDLSNDDDLKKVEALGFRM